MVHLEKGEMSEESQKICRIFLRTACFRTILAGGKLC